MNEKLVAACAKVRAESGRSSRPSRSETIKRHHEYKRSNFEKANAARRAATHCKHGHPFSGENLRVLASGARKCITCVNIFNRNRAIESRRVKDKASRRSQRLSEMPVADLAKRYELPSGKQEPRSQTTAEWFRLYGIKPKRFVRDLGDE